MSGTPTGKNIWISPPRSALPPPVTQIRMSSAPDSGAASDPAAPGVPGNVDRELGDARVPGAARAIGLRGRPRHNLTRLVLCHDDRIRAVEPPEHVLDGTRLRLERADAILDPLVVDPCDHPDVVSGRRPAPHRAEKSTIVMRPLFSPARTKYVLTTSSYPPAFT